MSRDLYDLIRALWSEDPVPARYRYAIEIEEARESFHTMRRVFGVGVIIAAAVAAGYVMGAWR